MQRKKIQLAELSDCPTKTREHGSSAEIIEVWKILLPKYRARAGLHKHRDLRIF